MSVVGEVEISADTASGGVCQVRLPDGTVFLEEFSITGMYMYSHHVSV